MTYQPQTCRSCAGRNLRRHCDNAGCDLLRCPDCGARGRPDGRRWSHPPLGVRSDDIIPRKENP